MKGQIDRGSQWNAFDANMAQQELDVDVYRLVVASVQFEFGASVTISGVTHHVGLHTSVAYPGCKEMSSPQYHALIQ